MKTRSRDGRIQELRDSGRRTGSAKMMDVALGGCMICLFTTILGVLLFVRAEFLSGSTPKKSSKPVAVSGTGKGKSAAEFKSASDMSSHEGTITRTGILGRHDGEVHDVAVKPGGKIAVSGGEDKQVRLWDLETGRGLNTLAGHQHAILSVAISSTGGEVASGDAGGVIRVWERESGKLLQEIKDRHAGGVRCVEFYPLGHVIVSGGSDRTVRLTEIHSQEELHKYAGHSAAVTAAILSHDGRHVLSGCEDGSVHAWAVGNESAPVRVFDGLEGAVLAISVSLDGNTVTALSANGTLGSWDIPGGSPVRKVPFVEKPKRGMVTAVSGSLGGYRVVFADDKHVLRLYDADQRRSDAGDKSLTDSVTAVAFMRQGRDVLCGLKTGELQIWKLPDPGLRELANAKAFAEEVEKRGLAHVEYGEHLEKGVDAVDEKDLDTAKKEFKIARDLSVAGTIEHDVADMGVDRCSKFDDKKERYTTLMEEGRDLMIEGNFTGARKKFEAAQSVHPDGEEAKTGIKRCDQAAKTEVVLRTANFPQQELNFDYRADGRDPLASDTDFVWLYSREKMDEFKKNSRSNMFAFSRQNAEEPPMGLGNSPLVWSARMETNSAVTMDNLKIRIRLIRAASNETISQHDTPLEKGGRVHQLNGVADAPEHGWTSGEYYFRKYLVAQLNDDEAKEFGKPEIEFEDNRPNAFRMGMIHWHKEERPLSPQDVQQSGGYVIQTRQSLAPGDAFRLDAEGIITPARPGFYREFFIGENVKVQENGPEGVGYPRQSLDFWKLRANGLPYGALLYMFESETALSASPLGKIPQQAGLPQQDAPPQMPPVQPPGLPPGAQVPPGFNLPNRGRVSPANRFPPPGMDPFQAEYQTQWRAFVRGNTLTVAEQGGSIRVSINSVLAKRKTLRQEFQQISARDDQYWRKDSPPFEIKLWRGEFDFIDSMGNDMRAYLLKPFRR